MTQERVSDITGKILYELSFTLGTSSGRSTLANLRNSMGRNLSQSIGIWALMFEKLPDSFLSSTGELTDEENAIIHALQFYALHQQGKPENVHTMENKNFGEALRMLRDPNDSSAIDRRFNVLITSTTYEEFYHHLRQMVNLLRSNKRFLPVNYARLAEDLYWFQRGYEENIRLRWAQNYYRRIKEEEEKQS